MSSCLAGAGRNTATAAAAAAAATFGFDHDVEFLKSASTSIRASPHSSSSSCFTSNSPSSTISESSNSLSPPLYICTRKPRTPRKRPNQTYNEAAALLSTAYPNIFSSKPSSFKFAKKPIVDEEEELLLPLSLPEKHFEPRMGLAASCSEPFRSPVEEDFDTDSILDEEIECGIDSIMGNLTVKGENIDDHVQQQQAATNNNFCYGIPMGLGLGLRTERYDFGFGMTRGVRAFRDAGYGGGEWWRFPAMTTVDVGAISPRLEGKPAVVEKKKSCNKKKKLPEEAPAAAAAAVVAEEEEESGNECRIELKLNYDEVLSAWSDRGSPFADDSAASEYSGKEGLARLAQIDLFGEAGGVREASVQRYKEKRRTRLFSKKIRYQVRKVNADQRPRMKVTSCSTRKIPDQSAGHHSMAKQGRFVRGTQSGADVQP